MHSFRDANNDQWNIELDIGKVLRIAKQDERFTLLAPTGLLDTSDERSQLQLRLADIRHAGMFFELLCLLVEEQAKTRGIGAEQFSRLVTPRLLQARRAFFDEWRDFFQNLQQTGEAWLLETIIGEMEQAEQEVASKIHSPEMQQIKGKARKKITSELSKSFGAALDTLESTLATTHGDN